MAAPVLESAPAAYREPLVVWRSKVADYLELTKPRIAVMVLFTVAIGAALAAGGTPPVWPLIHVVLGTALIAAGGSTLNQFIERHSDRLMRRTRNRPLPAGRLKPMEAAIFGMALGVSGVVYLLVTLPHTLTDVVAGVTFVSYVLIYTPLKRWTTLNTLVGAVPGALPPVIGWTAIRGTLDAPAVVLFSIVFLWQVPHFLAIAWIYREEYNRAGLRMLPGQQGGGAMAGRQMIAYCGALLAVSLAPAGLYWTGPVYMIGAAFLGLAFLGCAFAFVRTQSVPMARRVLRASLLYLPALLALLLLDTALRH